MVELAFQPVPDTASFLVKMSDNNLVEYRNKFYVRNTLLGWNAARLSAVATTIGNGWRDQIMPKLAIAAEFSGVDARDEGAEFGAQTTVPYNVVGAQAGEQMTGAVCLLLRLGGTSGGAPRKGRMFISPFVEGQISGDTSAGTLAADLLAGFDAINASIAGGGDSWVIVSRFSKAAVPAPPHKRAVALSNSIATRGIRTLIAMQRDRRTGEG